MFAFLVRKDVFRRSATVVQRTIAIERAKYQASHEVDTYREDFATRHIGVSEQDEAALLRILNVKVIRHLNTLLRNWFLNGWF